MTPDELAAVLEQARDFVKHARTVENQPVFDDDAWRARHDLLQHRLTETVRNGLGTARDRQVEIGPSEIMGCERRLAARIILGNTGDRKPSLRPWVGTQVHAGVDKIFREALEPGWIPGMLTSGPVPGHLDLYHLGMRAIVDIKYVGKTTMTHAKRHGPSRKYRGQVHVYADGIRQLGLPVDLVGVWYWLAGGDLEDMHLWTEPYDQAIVDEAYARVDRHRAYHGPLIGEPIADYLSSVPVEDDYCPGCPVAALGYCRGYDQETGKNPTPAFQVER